MTYMVPFKRPYFTDKDLEVLQGWWCALANLDLLTYDEFDNVGQDLMDIQFEMWDRDREDAEWEETCREMDDELEQDYP